VTPANAARARNTAATLLTISGIIHIGALWLRDIDGTALAAGLVGGIYLIIGLGLYGHSRFALLMAMAGPFAGVWLAVNSAHILVFNPLVLIQLCIAVIVITTSTVVLLTDIRNPSG